MVARMRGLSSPRALTLPAPPCHSQRWEDCLYEDNDRDPKDFYVAFYNMPSHIK